MDIKEILNNITEFFEENVAPPHKIVAVEKMEGENESGWHATVEVIEEKEYMKKYAKDEMLGTYSVKLDDDIQVVSFKREDVRYRSKVDH